ncbi:MAG: hypothetical protein ACOVRN_00490 [Flavobacterium sp.]
MSATRLTRSYSITNDSDKQHTANGRCPNYALTWSSNDHRFHWPSGHDYFLGNGESLDDETQELREVLSKRLLSGTLPKYVVFCDLDGVLADFEEGVKRKFSQPPDQLSAGLMWGVIHKSNTFFETLPWMPQGKALWARIQPYHPIILTGVTKNHESMTIQKRRWCARELGADVNVITCASKDKPKYCLTNAILIDDRPDNAKAWNEKGGKFMLYNEDYWEAVADRIDRHMTDEFGLLRNG